MRYSDEFKNHVVSRLLTGEVTIPQAQEQYGVSTFSLREWRKKSLMSLTVMSEIIFYAIGVFRIRLMR